MLINPREFCEDKTVNIPNETLPSNKTSPNFNGAGKPSLSHEKKFINRIDVPMLGLTIILYGIFRYWMLTLRGPFIDYDETYYLMIARNLFTGHGITLNGLPHNTYSPFFPIVTGLVAQLKINYLTASRLVSAMSGAGLLIPVFWIAGSIGGRKSAWLSALFLSSVPQLNSLLPNHSRKSLFYMGSEPLYLFLLFSAIALYLTTLHNKSYFRTVIAGILFGFAYLTRPEAAVAAVFCVLFKILYHSRKRNISWNIVTVQIILMTSAAVTVLIPTNLHLKSLTGQWVLFTRNFPSEMKETALDVIKTDRWDRDMTVRYSLDCTGTAMYVKQWGIEPDNKEPPSGGFGIPVRPWSARFSDGVRLYIYQVFLVIVPPVLWILALPGFFRRTSGIHTLTNRLLPYFALPVFSTSVVIVGMGFPMPRYQMILIPVIVVAAARGVSVLFEFLKQYSLKQPSRWVRWLAQRDVLFAALLVMFFFLTSFIQTLPFIGTPTAEDADDENVQMVMSAALDLRYGRQIAALIPPDASLMTWNPRLAWYAGRAWRVMPIDAFFGDWARVFHYAAARAPSNRIDFMALNVYGSPRGFQMVDKPVEVIDLRDLAQQDFPKGKITVRPFKTAGDIAVYEIIP
jgi:4-amino-4-deoxy-L-arabinose transferase-like glycosyltransferase